MTAIKNPCADARVVFPPTIAPRRAIRNESYAHYALAVYGTELFKPIEIIAHPGIPVNASTNY